MSKKDLVGVLVLVIGVLAGLLLLDQSTEYREKAKQEIERKVTLCHKTGLVENPWIEIEVKESELGDYIDSGDILGECP